MTRHVLVIGGGQNARHGDSLANAAAIAGALRAGGYTVGTVTIGRDGIWANAHGPLGNSVATSLAAALPFLEQADVVFPAVHGSHGADGTLAALCALLRKPVAGSGPRAGAIGMDRWTTKLVAEAIGIRTVPGRLVRAADLGSVAFEEDVIVKPVAAGAGLGGTLVRDAVQLNDALRTAARHDDRILVEHVVHGREIDVAVLREADGSCWTSSPLEAHPERLFDTARKPRETTRVSVPARLDSIDHVRLNHAALALFDTLGCAGVARVNFVLTDRGLVLNEIDPVPGMTEDARVPVMFAAAGVSLEELVVRMVTAASTAEPAPAVNG